MKLAPFLTMLLAAWLVVALTSCSRGFVFCAINNSGKDLTIISYDTKLNPKEYALKSAGTVDVSMPTRLVIKYDSGDWQYAEWDRQLSVNASIYKYERANGIRVQDIQIESNGEIYLLRDNRKRPPVKEFPLQPEGFPLKPKS
jgi:hypothetical protein